jgi:hypothetical protein
LNSIGINHLVILLNDGSYRCSCLSLVTRGIVCRHYFSVMLRTSQAQFHIGFLNSRWFIPTHLNIKDQLFYPASKFNADSINSPLKNNNLDFLNLTDDSISNSNNAYVSLSKQRLYYSNAQGLVKQANQIACKTCDESFISLLQQYIANKTHEALELEQYENINTLPEFDQENVRNPVIRRPKGRPPGNARFKGPLESSFNSNKIQTQNKCSLCNNIGHNRATCPLNPHRKKRRQC